MIISVLLGDTLCLSVLVAKKKVATKAPRHQDSQIKMAGDKIILKCYLLNLK